MDKVGVSKVQPQVIHMIDLGASRLDEVLFNSRELSCLDKAVGSFRRGTQVVWTRSNYPSILYLEI